MRRLLLALGMALAVAGCAAEYGGVGLLTMAAPDGGQYHRVKCRGTPKMCMDTAATACGGPYQVITSERHGGLLLADPVPGPVTWYTMNFVCGPSDGALPTFPSGGQSFTDAWNEHLTRQRANRAAQEQNRPITTY